MASTTSPAPTLTSAWEATAPGVFTHPTGWKIVNTQSVGYPWIVVQPGGAPLGPGRGHGYRSVERAQQVAADEIARVATLVLPDVGVTARFDLANGDSYIGEVHPDSARDLVVLRNYSAWYDGDTEPFNSEYDDEVQFRIDRETTISVF